MTARRSISAKERLLTRDRLRERLAYDADTGIFTWLESKWRRLGTAGTPAWSGHIRIKLDGHSHMAHRLAWLYVHGAFPIRHLDHINGNPSDNRIANLREATSAQNTANSHAVKKSISGRKGVTFHPTTGKWRARITDNGRIVSLGLFATPEEAAGAYAEAARKIFGAFARTT